MFKVKGLVSSVSDEKRSFAVKDKDGNPTSMMKEHRICQIVMLVKDGTATKPVVVRAFDPAPSFVCPKEGDTWETPEIMEYRATFRAVPEIGI